MAKRFSDTDKWKKGWIKKLTPGEKLVWVYLLDNCNHAGIWDVEIEVAETRLGIKINPIEVIKAFGDKIKVIDNGNKWFITNFISFQYGILNPLNRAHKSVIDILEKCQIRGYASPSQGATQGCKDKDKDKDMDKDKEEEVIKEKKYNTIFIKPTIPELTDYIKTKNLKIDAEYFFDFYESKGWVVGKNKMKDWKAAVRNWERRRRDTAPEERSARMAREFEEGLKKQEERGNAKQR